MEPAARSAPGPRASRPCWSVCAQSVRCPEAHHADSRIQSRGTLTNKQGVRRRYLCTRADGSRHSFQLLFGADGSVLTSPTRRRAVCSRLGGSCTV